MELWFRIAACLDGMRPLPNAEATSLRARVWRHLSFLALLTMAACVPSFGMHHNNALRHAHRSRRHLRGIAGNPMFRPSHDSLLRQYEEIDRVELPRIPVHDGLAHLKAGVEVV